MQTSTFPHAKPSLRPAGLVADPPQPSWEHLPRRLPGAREVWWEQQEDAEGVSEAALCGDGGPGTEHQGRFHRLQGVHTTPHGEGRIPLYHLLISVSKGCGCFCLFVKKVMDYVPFFPVCLACFRFWSPEAKEKEENREELDIPYYCSPLKAICLCQGLVCER